MRFTLFSFLLLMSFLARGADTPNIVLILADDLGWGDTGCYGNERFETPNLDRMAAGGLRFTQAYSGAPICSASRASLLTGKTTARLGFEFVTKNEPGFQPMKDTPLRAPPFTLNLPLGELTIPEVLAHNLFQTAFFGKWHLNQHYQGYLGWSPTHGPPQQGFETAVQDFGSHPYSYWNDKESRDFLPLEKGTFPTDTLNEAAIAFIKEEHEKPFFLMMSHFYVHTPVHTRIQWLYEHYLEKFPEDHPRREDLAHFGAMVANLDHLVGDLLTAIDESGEAENTLVVFTSDNGGHPDYAGNAPLRGSKWNLYEGGIRVPMIARWPGTVAAGSVSDEVVTGTDLLATFADAADLPAPENTDGRSFLSILKTPGSSLPERQVVWHFPYYHPEKGFSKAPESIGVNDGVTSKTKPHSAIRIGSWKLIHFYEDGRDELYQIDSDLSEEHDRSQSDPEVASRLRKQLDSYLKEVEARLPTPNPESNE